MDDVPVPQHHRSGAHRVRRHPLLVAVLTLGAVALASAALLWALLSFDVLGVGDDLLEAGGASPGGPAVPSVTPQPSPGTVAGTGGTAAGVPSSPGAAPEVPVDRSLLLDVLNATTTTGLATAAAGVLEEAGWSVDDIGNYGGEDGPSVVLYPRGDEAAGAAAAAVAVDLGVGEAVPSPEVDGVTVVVGEDFEP